MWYLFIKTGPADQINSLSSSGGRANNERMPGPEIRLTAFLVRGGRQAMKGCLFFSIESRGVTEDPRKIRSTISLVLRQKDAFLHLTSFFNHTTD